jgi:hypothetical protein
LALVALSVAGFVAHAWIIGRAGPTSWNPEVKGVVTCAIAARASFLEMWVYMVIALNTYGA